MHRNFDPDAVIESYQLQKVLKSHKKNKLMDFIKNLKSGSKVDMKIMETWTKHFKSNQVPFAITEHPCIGTVRAKYQILWKEWVVDPNDMGKIYTAERQGKGRGAIHDRT